VDYHIFLVTRSGQLIENVIVEAIDRELAKRYSHPILGGNSDQYVVTPIVAPGSRTVCLLGGRGGGR
jgi:hypothetical protein